MTGELLSIFVLVIVLLGYELVAKVREHKQLSSFYEVDRRSTSLEQTIKDRSLNLRKHRKHHAPKD